MSVKMSRKAKGVLAVTVAASINGALFAPTAMAVEQEPTSESRLATGKRINTNINTNNDALDRGLNKCQSVSNELDQADSRIRDVDMEPEVPATEQAEQDPQQVLQLLRGVDDDKAEGQSQGTQLSTGKRINLAEETTSDSLANNDSRLTQAGDDGLTLNSDRLNNVTREGSLRDNCDVDKAVAAKPAQVESPVTENAPTDSDNAAAPTAVSDAAPVESVIVEDDGVHAATSGSSDDGTQTLAKTGSETTLFAGIAAAIAGALGAMLMWFSRKQKRQS